MPKTFYKTFDAMQIQKYIFDQDKAAWRVISLDPMIPNDYDELDITYIAAGNGTGEIGTVTYKKSATQIALLTLTYDSQNRLISVVRT